MKKPQIVRGLWGNFSHFKNDIPLKPLYNEIVYVWGVDNNDQLKKLGYSTILVSKNNSNYDKLYEFFHKIEVFKLSNENFSSFLYLDWDVIQIKKLDDYFYHTLCSKEIQVPLYSYPKQFLEIDHDGFNENILFHHKKQLKKYSWKYKDMFVLPNAGFFYTSYDRLGDELYKISKKYNLSVLIEEFSLQIFCNCKLKDYIITYEPEVIYGRPTELMFEVNGRHYDNQRVLHEYINPHKFKYIYLEHI